MFEELALPSSKEFATQALEQKRQDEALAKFNRGGGIPEPIARESVRQAGLAPKKRSGISNEIRGLLVQYCASYISAIELEQVNFAPMAIRLGTHEAYVKEAAETANADGTFWEEVLIERIRRIGAARVFRDVTWERVETRALSMLDRMMEMDMIRDAGELLAIANAARKINLGDTGMSPNDNNMQVNFNLGGGDMADGLPANGTRVSIDLSPRLAKSLAMKSSDREESRIIDSKMLSAKELREMLGTDQSKDSVNQGDE